MLQAEENLARQLERVDQLVKQNQIESAVNLLTELIVTYAKQKDFDSAEVLKEKLFEVDPMALTEIIKSAEIIEQAKAEAMGQDHLDVWQGLYATLTAEESKALFEAMKEDTYDADKLIAKQGETNPNLYFVNQGQLKIVYRQKDKEVFLKNLGPGDIAGEESFFANTVCTTSIVTLSLVKLHVLGKEILTAWDERFPALKSKLEKFCLGFEKIQDLLKKKGMDRRTQKRVKISGNALFQLLDASGDPIGNAFKGDLADISAGGLSFIIKTSKEKIGRTLLGRKLNVKFSILTGEFQHKIDKNVTVIGVHYRVFNNYSIHMKFDATLDNKIVEGIEAPANSGQW
jgi:CRP-like cAMP-binding protein